MDGPIACSGNPVRVSRTYAYAYAGDAKVTRSARRIANGCCAARDETGSCRRTQCKPAGSSQRPSGSQPQFQPRAALHSTRKMLAGELEPHPPAHLSQARAPVGAQLTPDRGSLSAEPRTARSSSETVGPALGLRSHPGAQDRPNDLKGAADIVQTLSLAHRPAEPAKKSRTLVSGQCMQVGRSPDDIGFQAVHLMLL